MRTDGREAFRAGDPSAVNMRGGRRLLYEKSVFVFWPVRRRNPKLAHRHIVAAHALDAVERRAVRSAGFRLDAEAARVGKLGHHSVMVIRDEIAELRALLTRDPVDGAPVLPGDTADVDVPVGG